MREQEYLEAFTDGIRLLRRQPLDSQSVFVMGVSNPFQMALGLPPLRRDYAYLYYGENFSENNFMLPQKLFDTVSLIMIPKLPYDPDTTRHLLDIYGSYLS